MRRLLLYTTVAVLGTGCRRDTSAIAPPEPAPLAQDPVAVDPPREPAPVETAIDVDCSDAAITAVVEGTRTWTAEGHVCLDAHRRGCGAGDADGCIRAGTILIHGLGGVAADPPAAFALEMDACGRGIAPACNAAAMMYERGMGTAADPAAGAALRERACELGDAMGCAAPPAKHAALVPDANVTVDSIAADGLELRQLACAVESMPLLGTLAIVGSFAKHKRAIDRCAPQGQAFEVTWTFASGRVKDAVVRGGTPRANACISKALSRAVAPLDGRCGAVVLAGKPEAAAATIDALGR